MIDEDEVWRNEELQKIQVEQSLREQRQEVVENEVYEDERSYRSRHLKK